MNNFDQALRKEIPSCISVEKNHAIDRAIYRAKLLKKAKVYRQSAKFVNVKKGLLDIISSKNF
jgi:hypothetical protein